MIYGHRDPEQQAKERLLLETARQSAALAQNADAVRLAEFRLVNLGRKVTLDTLLVLQGTNKSKKWEIKATCSCCGEPVHLQKVHSLKGKTVWAHPALDPVTAPKERCDLRANLDTRYIGHEGTYDPDAAKRNRAAFFQPEIVASFVQVAKAVLAHNYKPEIPAQILRRADELKAWNTMHDPKLAPFQLLALTGNKFDVTFKEGRKARIGFVLDKVYSPEAMNAGQIEPSEVRMFGIFADRQRQGETRLWTIPGVQKMREHLIEQSWLDARREVTKRQGDFLGAPALPATANFGESRDHRQYLIVNHSTVEKLAPHTYGGLQKAIADGGSVSENLRTLLARTDTLIAQFGAGPIREPRAAKAKARPQPVGAT
ncbi:MAG: hypothetical protein KBA75_01330 [Alphaproteobacteria bacterium]|nr:hypothetical protein [Alphaproteobacteria bacterium]